MGEVYRRFFRIIEATNTPITTESRPYYEHID